MSVIDMKTSSLAYSALFWLCLSAASAYALSAGISGVSDALYSTYNQFEVILPPLAMLLIILGAVTYAAGKLVPNPEFSGRASGLAAGMIAASVILFAIMLVLPVVLQAIYPCDNGCWDMSIVSF